MILPVCLGGSSALGSMLVEVRGAWHCQRQAAFYLWADLLTVIKIYLSPTPVFVLLKNGAFMDTGVGGNGAGNGDNYTWDGDWARNWIPIFVESEI